MEGECECVTNLVSNIVHVQRHDNKKTCVCVQVEFKAKDQGTALEFK